MQLVKNKDTRSPLKVLLAATNQNGLITKSNNRAYPENTNFETFVSKNFKFHTFGDLHTTKEC